GHAVGGFLEQAAAARILGAFHPVLYVGPVVPVAIGDYDSRRPGRAVQILEVCRAGGERCRRRWPSGSTSWSSAAGNPTRPPRPAPPSSGGGRSAGGSSCSS